MKNSKSFRYKFTPLVWALISLVVAIALAGVGFNVYKLATSKGALEINIVSLIIILIINLLLTAFALSVMVFSKYVIKNDCVISYFGFIKSKTKISQIEQFTHFKKSNKLVAYFIDQKYTVIVITPEKYDEFVKAVRDYNAKIVFDAQEEN